LGDLGPLPRIRRSGHEVFHVGGQGLDFCLQDFWQWSASDIVSNSTRGKLAEFLIANAIGAADGVRDEWAAYDLLDPRGISIEVKSAAFIQSWKQKSLSAISFSCKESFAWDPETGEQDSQKRRQADVYVFALLAHQDQATLDPFDIKQWQFFVVPTVVLDRRKRSQHSITLKSLHALHGEAITYAELAEAIAKAAAIQRAEISG